MQMANGPLVLLIICSLVCGCNHSHATTDSRHVKRVAPPIAPMVSCTITMKYWCIVQADAGLSMVESGNYRVWKMTAPNNGREIVSVLEDRRCDTIAALEPRRKSEREAQSGDSGEKLHAVELMITSSGACTLTIQYVAGDTDWARQSTRFATYRFYLCNNGSCRLPLLKVN